MSDTTRHDCPTVLDWSDERAAGNPIMVTLRKGFAFEDAGHSASAQHVKGFATVAEARRGTAKKRLQICTCARCGGKDEQ